MRKQVLRVDPRAPIMWLTLRAPNLLFEFGEILYLTIPPPDLTRIRIRLDCCLIA